MQGLITAANDGEGSVGLMVLVLAALAWVVGYAISLVIHPYTRCRLCNGRSRHYGAIYRGTFRLCRRCGGKGRKPRLGVRIFRSGWEE